MGGGVPLSLAPEHLEDLKASGLTDATIAALRFTSLCPSDIPVRGAQSAYALPYFNLDGSVNCFKRVKLVPGVKDATGHAQKYWQQPGSQPGLYLPPSFFNWQSVAHNAQTSVTITEGEKKSAAACQAGIITAGVGGVWNWTSTISNGERLVLPVFDAFQWSNRPVLMCPDSDAWQEGKAFNILAGFFALAKELEHRGAVVRFVLLPHLHGTKTGLDDWLLTPGNDSQHSWQKLHRVALDDARFLELTAWWQRWKEKRSLEDQLASEHAELPDIETIAGCHRVRFAGHRVLFQFQRLIETHNGEKAEMAVYLGTTELLGLTDIGLKTETARKNIAKTLLDLAPQFPWKRLLERACASVLKAHREGAPVVTLKPTEHTSTHVRYILNPLIYRNHQTLAFAPGGSCKSYLALYFALLACQGSHQAGVAALKVPVLYLDWELDEATVTGRLKALQAGHPELANASPFYRRCEYPLHQDVHEIASQVAHHGIQLLIIDSAALACGGDLSSPDSAIRLQRALRTIGCSSLVLAHVPKSIQEGQEASAYGTVFFRELARNVWEFQRTGNDNPVQVALHQKKNNFGPALPPLGFELTFSDQSVRVEACDPQDEPAEEKLAVPSRIRNLLEDGTPRRSKKIAEELGLKHETVKSALSRDKGRKWMMLGEDYRNPLWTILSSK
jgi:hypothetical protein